MNKRNATLRPVARRTALLQLAGMAAAGAALGRTVRRVEAGGNADAIQHPTIGTPAFINTASGRTHLQNPNAAPTLSLQNTNASSSASRSALYAYVGTAATLPAADASAAVRAVNDSGLAGSSGVVGRSHALQTAGVIGTSNDGIGVSGETQTGTGVLASAPSGGTALAVDGRMTVTGGTLDIESQVSILNELAVSGIIAGHAPEASSVGVAVTSSGGTGFLAHYNSPGASPREGTPRETIAAFAADVFGDVIGADLLMQDALGTGLRIRTSGGPAVEVHGASNFSGSVTIVRLTGGPAVEVQGPSTFEGRVGIERFGGVANTLPVFENAGTATIPAGKSAVRVTDPRVSSGVTIIATIQGNPGLGVVLKGVTPLAGKFNITLNKRAAKAVRVGYLLLGKP